MNFYLTLSDEFLEVLSFLYSLLLKPSFDYNLGDKRCEHFIKTNEPDNPKFEDIIGKSEKVSRKRLLQMNCRNSQMIDHFTNSIFTVCS